MTVEFVSRRPALVPRRLRARHRTLRIAELVTKSYDLGIDQSHVNFMESKLERKIFQGAKLSESEMLPLAVVSMSGVAAEAMEFDEVMGQSKQ